MQACAHRSSLSGFCEDHLVLAVLIQQIHETVSGVLFAGEVGGLLNRLKDVFDGHSQAEEYFLRQHNPDCLPGHAAGHQTARTMIGDLAACYHATGDLPAERVEALERLFTEELFVNDRIDLG